MSNVVSSMLNTGDLQRFILHNLQPHHARRYHLLRAAICTTLVPLGCQMVQLEGTVAGGYLVWLMLPQGITAKGVAQSAIEEENLVMAAGSMFEVPGENTKDGTEFDAHLRLCCVWEDEAIMLCGIERLSKTIERLLVAHAVVDARTP
jgi:DNA-binding transcriptional MocR family regulator